MMYLRAVLQHSVVSLNVAEKVEICRRNKTVIQCIDESSMCALIASRVRGTATSCPIRRVQVPLPLGKNTFAHRTERLAVSRNRLDVTHVYFRRLISMKETDMNTQTKHHVSLHVWYLHYHQHFHDHNKRCEHSHFCRHTTTRSSPVWVRIISGIWYQALLPQVLTRTSS
jgi:hypothetical protein